jgi:hypothetical protein
MEGHFARLSHHEDCATTSRISERAGLPSGTACLIGPWLALTARHVIEDHFLKFEGVEPSGIARAGYEVLTYVNLGGGGLLSLFVRRAWLSLAHDIAVLWAPACAIDPNHVWTIPRLAPMPPAIDSLVAAIGYPNSSFEFQAPTDHLLVMDATTSTGRVIEVHDLRRDSVMLPFPCFRVNARFDGGMSGGPVMNEIGWLCGVVCSSMPPADLGDTHDSYVSTIWPVLRTMIDAPWDKLPPGTAHPLLDYARAGIIDVRDVHLPDVPVQTIDPGPQVTVSFPGFPETLAE